MAHIQLKDIDNSNSLDHQTMQAVRGGWSMLGSTLTNRYADRFASRRYNVNPYSASRYMVNPYSTSRYTISPYSTARYSMNIGLYR